MANITQVLQTPSFKKTVKKLHQNQKVDLDNAVKALIEDPLLGEPKKGDLSFFRVYKFKMVKEDANKSRACDNSFLIIEPDHVTSTYLC